VTQTDSDAAASCLARDILSGRYDIGPTPLREALSRLAAG